MSILRRAIIILNAFRRDHDGRNPRDVTELREWLDTLDDWRRAKLTPLVQEDGRAEHKD